MNFRVLSFILAVIFLIQALTLSGCTKTNNITHSQISSLSSQLKFSSIIDDNSSSGSVSLSSSISKSISSNIKSLIPTSSSSSSVISKSISNIVSKKELLKIALLAQKDMYKNFWEGDSITGHIAKEDHGYKTNGKQVMIWAHAMMLFGMETMYEVTGDNDIKNKIIAQWNFTKDNFSEENLTTPGKAPNIAVDDAGWDAMAYMLFYRITGDDYALKVAGKTIKNSFEYWKDGSTSNGLWYLKNNNPNENAKWKSLYCTGLLIAALQYYEITKDASVYNDFIAVYNWIEKNLLRNGRKEFDRLIINCSDNLYWADFNVNRDTRTEKNGPDGGYRPYDIKEAGSVSFLGGNMAMTAIHAKLYKITGDENIKQELLKLLKP